MLSSPWILREGFLLAGKRGVRQVLGGGRGAHGKGHVGGRIGDQALVLAEISTVSGRKGSVHDPLADLFAADGQRIDVIDVQRIRAALILASSPLCARNSR